MKNKAKSAVCCLAAVLLCTLSGCQLAQADKGADAAQDRLVGVFVTTEYLDLFDMEGYLNANLNGTPNGEITLDGTAQEYQGRLYATLKKKTLTNEETGEKTETDEYAFEDVDGIPYFFARMPKTAEHESYGAAVSDDAISDGHTGLNIGDLENSTALEGTIYVSAGGGQSTFYFNPVYQTAGGKVYATTGSGLSSGGEQSEGVSFTQTLTASQTLTENGKTKKDSISVKLTVQMMNPPKKIAILQMDSNNVVLSRTEFTPGTLPKEITPKQGVEYIVVETTQSGAEGNEKVTRKLYAKDAEMLETFWCREDGICVKQWTQVLWPDTASLSVS